MTTGPEPHAAEPGAAPPARPPVPGPAPANQPAPAGSPRAPGEARPDGPPASAQSHGSADPPGEPAETLPTRYPPRGIGRLLLAYRVTLTVLASYLLLRFRLRFADGPHSIQLLRDAHRRNARRIHTAIARLQGLFIKVGQLISILTNFLPEEFREQLTTLQDRVPPRPFPDVERRFREEFSGRGPLEVFAEFSRVPVASASIGQVHRARTRDGIDVAVKVQYPDIEEIVRLDLRALSRIFQIASWYAPHHGLQAVFAEIRSMILQELDFELEARSLQRIAANFGEGAQPLHAAKNGVVSALAPHPPLGVGFPEVHGALSTSRVLTTGWVDGVKINNLTRLSTLGVDRAALARTIVTAYCQQIFRDGLYHADPHPGNLLVVQRDGRTEVVFIDFGAVAELSPAMRRGIVEVIQAALTRDTPRLIASMKDMGFIARGADTEIFERVVDFFHEKFQAEVKLDSLSLRDVRFDPDKALSDLADLKKLDVSLRDLMDHFHVPKEWILLERTLLLLLGLCTDLDPQLNPMTVIKPYLEAFVLGDRDWSTLLVETTRDVVTTALGVPGDLRKFLVRAQRGQLEVRVRGLEDSSRLLYTLGHQIIYLACGITAFAAAVVFEGRGEAYASRAQLAAYTACGFGGLLVFSMATTRLRRGRRR